ncbi:MAG: hypothetical protein QM703_03780 [Gemmatales bacterium]
MPTLTPHKYRRPSWTEIGDVSIWTVLTLALGLLPTWLLLLVQILTKKNPDLSDYVSHGEFALYTASILSGTLYIVSRNNPSGYFPMRPLLITVIVILIILSTLLSTIIYVKDSSIIDTNLYAKLTIPFFIAGMIVSAASLILEKQIDTPDIKLAGDDEVTSLGNKVNARRTSRSRKPKPDQITTPEATALPAENNQDKDTGAAQ